jgi:hypothetical protein
MLQQALLLALGMVCLKCIENLLLRSVCPHIALLGPVAQTTSMNSLHRHVHLTGCTTALCST